MKVKWLSLAQADLDEVERYIAKDSPRCAVTVVLQVIEAVEVLCDNPSLGRAGRINGTRELVLSGLPFIIPYRKKDGWIEILRVFHQSRRWPETL